MTALSSLLGGSGGGGHPYPSGVPLFGPLPDDIAVVTGTLTNRDIIIPFVPRADLTVDKVCWWRGNTTAANVYVGVYGSSGNLLTDCAVDADTTEGIHEVETTDADLTAGNLYYIALNQSANVAMGDILGSADDSLSSRVTYINNNPIDFGIYSGGTAPITIESTLVAEKSRTNAALLNPMTMSGFSAYIRYALVGVVAA